MLIPSEATLSLSTTISHVTVFFASYYDGINETLEINDFEHPSLTIEYIPSPVNSNAPYILYISGTANANIYLDALWHIYYTHKGYMPTTGNRVIGVKLYNGINSNTAVEAYINLGVYIHNMPPVVSVNGDQESYTNRFYPRNGPVSAINPEEAIFVDKDSTAIQRATVQLVNSLDGADESLKVTYTSPETLSLPVNIQDVDINLPFGQLFSGKIDDKISHSITVNNTGIVGDVDVVVDIRHSWIGDLKLELEHANRRVLLVLSPGGQTCSRDNLFSTTFDTDSSANVTLSKSTSSPGLCQFQTQGLFSPDNSLKSFIGDPIEGQWILHITDLLPEEDNGRLVSWGLVIQPNEAHLIVSNPPVVPPLTVGGLQPYEEQHKREVDADGRITDISVHVHLTIPFIADHLYLPTLKLIHPDGTEVLLSNDKYPLCAYGNYTYLIFDDRASSMEDYTDYSCHRLYNDTSDSYSGNGARGSGASGNGASGSGASGSGASGSGSGSSIGFAEFDIGSVSGIGSGEDDIISRSLTLFDILNFNVTIPTKNSLADILVPQYPLSTLKGKQLRGDWTLAVSSDYYLDSTLVGWSLRISHEPNIDSWYDVSTSTLVLDGSDSATNYQTVLRSTLYNNNNQWPDFSEIRLIKTKLYDGEEYSNSSLPGSQSLITIHHLNIDLDPLDISKAISPNFASSFTEHGSPIPIVDSNNALLTDPVYETGIYILIITLNDYNNYNDEGVTVNTSAFPDISVNEYVKELDDTMAFVLNISSISPQPIEYYQSVLRTTEYFNDAEELIGDSRVVEFVLEDVMSGNRFTSDIAVTEISLITSNDAPVLLLNPEMPEVPYKVDYSEGQGEVLLTNPFGLNLTDNDDEYLQAIVITITNAMDGEDEILSLNDNILNETSITYDYNVSTNTLSLLGEDTLENYIKALLTVSYENMIHSPGEPNPTTRVVSFTPNDGKTNGLPNVTMVSYTSVNDAPFGYLNGLSEPDVNTTVIFVEELGPVALISSNVMLFDVDNMTLSYLTIQILNPYDSEFEELSVMNISEKAPESNEDVVVIYKYIPSVSYDASNSVLTVSGLESIYEYQQVLKTLTYVNHADEPNPVTRIVEIIMNDGIVDSKPLYCHVEIELVNDSPFFNDNTTPFQREIYEDVSGQENVGFAVSEMAYLLLDDDVDSIPGIAIVNADVDNGVWQYMLPYSTWLTFETNISLNYALVLSASENSNTSIRFVPGKDFNGNSSISIVLWDATDGSTDGSYVNAASKSAIDPFSADILKITLIVIPVNDAPVLSPIPLNFTSIYEDDYNSTGDSVLSLLDYASDVDIPLQQNELGIAVINAQQTNGKWQYTHDEGDSWFDFGPVSEESALLLSSLPEERNRIRFVPERDYNGFATIQFVAWDLLYTGFIDTGDYNQVSDILTPSDLVTINFSGDMSGPASGIGDMSGSASGIGDMSGSASGIGDISGSASGIGDISGSASGSGSVFIPDPTPLPKYINTTMADPLTGPLSSNSTSVTILIEPVNDSPIVIEGMRMEAINEDLEKEANHGTKIANIISGYYSDVDAYPHKGLAIVEVDNRHGQWQYTCASPGNASWEPFIGDIYFDVIVPLLPLPEKATLLLESCWIRFLPEAHFNTELDYNDNLRPYSDTPYIVAYGWDNTGLTEGLSDTYGNDATYGNESETNEYSFNNVTIPILINSRGDVPILKLTNETVPQYNAIFYEDLLSVPAVGEGLVLIDHDHARLKNVTITIYGEFDESPYDETELDEFITDFIAESGEANIVASGYASASGMQLEESLSYVDLLQEYVKTILNPSYLEVYCAGLDPRREELLIDVTYTDLITEVLSWCPFSILIYPDPNKDIIDSDKAMFQKVLRNVRYNNSVQEPLEGDRTITFIVSDDFGFSIPVNTTMYVQLINDAPILDINDFIPDINNYVMYTEGDSPLILVNSSGLRLVDFDNDYLQYATISLVEAPDTINETLTADTAGTNIKADYTNYTLYLTGNDTVEAYASVLSTITYFNNYSDPGNPDQRDREVIFVVSDGEKESLPAVSIVSFLGINDRPSIDVNGAAFGVNYTVEFKEEKGPVSVVSSYMILVDEDNTTLEYVTAKILNPSNRILETLEVDSVVLQRVLQKNLNDYDKVVQYTHLIPNVTYNSTTSTLYITGLDTVYEYRLVLKTITYNNEADEFSVFPRLIEFVASDGLLQSNFAYTTVEMTPINDSPFFNDEEVIVPHIFEDDRENDGNTVYDIADSLIEDDDTEYMEITRGIAVIDVETEYGDWEFRLKPTGEWISIDSNADLNYALLLSASENNSIRFVPNQDFNGNASLTFVAWDRVDELPDGMYRTAISNNKTDPFSKESRVLTVVIVPVNDAPVLNASHVVNLPSILEDDVIDRPSIGYDASVFLSTLVRDVDQDEEEHEFGVAIIEADQTNGRWQISTDGGLNWVNITNPTLTSGVVLHTIPNGQHRIRFAPDNNFNGDTSLKFKLWDMNVTYISGLEGVNTETDQDTGTFSKDIATATLDIEPVNDSPRLLEGPKLFTINEDILTSVDTGTYVSEIVRDLYGDDDDGFDIGIAVVGTDIRNGEWQYTCDVSITYTTWTVFFGGYQFGQALLLPNVEIATLLLGSCRIRFVPNANFNTEFDLNGNIRPASDTPYISIRGWDNTGNTNGLNMNNGIDTTSDPDDHTNSFSRDIQTATITVLSENDRPEVYLDGISTVFETTFTEPITPNRAVVPVPVVDPVMFSIIDVDNAYLRSARVSFQLYDGGMEQLLINTTTTNLNYTISVSDFYVLTLEPINGDTSAVEDFEIALRTLEYLNTAEEPNSIDRSLIFNARDESSSSFFSITTLYIELVNDPPELDLNAGLNDTYNFVNYSEGQGPVLLIDPSLSLIDYDNTTLDHIMLTITEAPDDEHEILSADSSNSSIVVTYTGYVLLLQGPATVDEFIEVLKTVTYNNTLSDPGDPTDSTRIIEIVANDGLDDSFTASVFLFFMAINNKPILDVNGKDRSGFNFATMFYEEQGPIQVVAEDTILIDIDNDTLEYMQIYIENPLDGSYERLWVENVTEYIGKPSDAHYSVWNFWPQQFYNYSDSSLIVTGLDTVYEYQQVLRTLKYNNKADEPNNEMRRLLFIVSDGLSLTSGVTTTIEMISVNDSPYINKSATLYHPIIYEDITNEDNIGWSLDDFASNLILDDDADSIQGIAIINVDTEYGFWEYTTNYVDIATDSESGVEGSSSGSGMMDMIMSAFGMSGSGSTDEISGDGDIDSTGSASNIFDSDTFDSDTLLWYHIPDNSSIQYATVLHLNDFKSRIRFIPNANFYGNVTISFVAWDTTDQLEDGTITDATSKSMTDPYSSQSVTLTVTVEPVNDAPMLSDTIVNMTQINEDYSISIGDEVSLFVSGVSDIDFNDKVFGIAIIYVDDNGIWQFSTDGGLTWISIISVSSKNVLLLSSYPTNTNRIRLLPNKDYNGYASIRFVAWDITSGEISGTMNVDITNSNPVSGSFSTSDAQAILYIEPVNDSPFVYDGMHLHTIYEDLPVADNNGTAVKDIADGFYYDVDANSEVGFAVVEVDIRNGVWRYWCPGWDNWMDFIGDIIYGHVLPPLPLPEKATLLQADCRIQYLPNPLFNTFEDIDGNPRQSSDTPFIDIRGWDNTGISKGLSGQYGIDTSYNNDSIINEFSAETVRVLILIDSIDNPSELRITSEGDGQTYNVIFTEDDPYVRIVDPSAVEITDVDNATLQSVTIEVTNVYNHGDEMIDIILLNDSVDIEVNYTSNLVTVFMANKTETIQLFYSSDNDSDVAVYNLTLQSPSEDEKVSVLAYQELLRHVVYINKHTEPINTTRIIRFHVNDRIVTVSNVNTIIEYKLLAENHPVLTTYLYDISFTEGDASPIPIVAENLTLTDEDHNEFFYISQAEMYLSPIPVSIDERLSVNLTDEYFISQYYDETSGWLLIFGDAPIAVYQDLLRTSVYHNTIEEPIPGERNISILVTDSDGLDSNLEYVFITVTVVNDQKPVIQTASEPFYYIEHHVNSKPKYIPIHENLTVSDADSGDLPLQSITFNITNPENGVEYEFLNATSNEHITVSYSDAVLTLDGPASIESFQDVLSTVSYINTAEEPIVGERVIEVLGYDGLFYSTLENISVIIILINDPPVIDLNGEAGIDINYMTEYIEGSDPVSIVNKAEFLVRDNDDKYLTQATIVLDTIYDTDKEVLAVDIGDTNITATYEYTGKLLLNGTATLSDYQDVLKTATYDNLEAEPGNPNTTMRRIIFTVYDGENSSIPAVTYLGFASVNDPPILDLNGNAPYQNYTTEFIEDGESVLLSDVNITLVDIDSDVLSEVQVEIINCLDGDMEDLGVLDDSNIPDCITVISLTCALNVNGYCTVEEFRNVIASITYQNIADEPDYTERLIKFVVNDGLIDSDPQYTVVTIVPVNDPPRIQISAPPGVYDANDFDIENTDSTDTASGLALISGSGSGSGSGGSDIDSTDPPMEDNDNFSMSGSGNSSTVNITRSIFITQYIENAAAVSIVQPNFVTVEDDDDTELVRIEVVLQNEVDIGFETIFISEQSLDTIPDEDTKNALKFLFSPYVQNGCPIGGSHFSTIDINLPLSLENINYTLKSLHYCNTENHPNSGDRNITFRVQDSSGDWSNTETTIVQVIAVNDAPILNTSIPFDFEIEIQEDDNITVSVLHLFYDFEEELNGNSINILSVEPDIGNAVVDTETGDIAYYSVLNDYGTRVIYYQACDSQDGCSPVVNLTIVIQAVNDPPFPEDNLTLQLFEDVKAFINLTDFFGDIEDDANVSSLYPKATFSGEETLLLNILIKDNDYGGLLEIVSRQNKSGTDILKLDVCDSDGSCIVVPLTVIIQPINDIPEIVINYEPGLSYASTNEDTSVNISITIYDIESTLTTPVHVEVTNEGNGTVTVSEVTLDNLSIVPDSDPVIYRRGGLKQEMIIKYTPNVNFYGSDYITIFANDSEGGYTEQNIDIIVNYINDPPNVAITTVFTDEDNTLVIVLPTDLDATDPEDELHAGSFTIIQYPMHGSLSYTYNTTYFNETGYYPSIGTLVYQPENEFYTTEENPEYFIIQVCDDDVIVPEKKLCVNATINIEVISTNDPPSIPSFTREVEEENILSFNLWEKTSDVEDILPPVELIEIIEPYPKNGTVEYDTTTGVVTYTPAMDFYGVDNVYYSSCDSEGSCNTSGHFIIQVLDVNDPPVAQDFTHRAEEDDFDLIDIRANSHDSEDRDDLSISIISPTTGDYIQEGTTSIGATLKVYQTHGLITYEPPSDFVGVDSFRYAVCDICDIRRNSEFGRTNLDDYPQCTRQLENNGNSRFKSGENVDITCDEATVTVKIINTHDVPKLKVISGVTHEGATIMLTPFESSRVSYGGEYYYSNSSAFVYDPDDYQSIEAQREGLNLSEFNLHIGTDVDELSMTIQEDTVGNGVAEVVTGDGPPYISYIPNEGFSGYDEFTFIICDYMTDYELARCSASTARIYSSKPGPEITSIRAVSNVIDEYHTDSKVSRGDKVFIEFGEDTNMPPHQSNTTLNADEIDNLFEFPEGFISSSYRYRYSGNWVNPRQFQLTVEDEGYPQPESKIGEWRVRVKAIADEQCGGFDENGQRVTDTDSNCLLSADRNSLHSSSTSPPLSGDWGLRLPDLTNILIRNIAVEDDSQVTTTEQLVFEKTHIVLILKEPLSYNQLILYCEQNASQILTPNIIGEDVVMIVVGCENSLTNGENAIDSGFSVQPVASQVTLQLQSFTSLHSDPYRDGIDFINNVKEGLNRTTLAYVVNELLGVNITVLQNYDENIESNARPITGIFKENDDTSTPKIVSITANDPSCRHTEYGVGDTITMVFDRNTDQPEVSTQEDIDKIFIFTPSLGLNYRGEWISPSELVIIITTLGDGPFPSNTDFLVNFTGNYINDNTILNSSNPDLPTDNPQCIGINVCGQQTGEELTVGVCSEDQLSCRAYESFSTIQGDFGGDVSCEAVATTSMIWLWVLLVVIVIIVATLFVLLIYYFCRKYKQKKQKEEAIRVVERWQKGHFSPNKKKDEPVPWSKPPDVSTMRDQPDPFKEKNDPLKNLPEIARPPTAAPAENLPPIETIPTTFKPRAGARITPTIPTFQPLPLSGRMGGRYSTGTLPSLTPLVSDN